MDKESCDSHPSPQMRQLGLLIAAIIAVARSTHLHLRLHDTDIGAVHDAAIRASGLGPGAGQYLSAQEIADLSGR